MPITAVPREDGSGDFEVLGLTAGDLSAMFWDNTHSPTRLSGIRSLVNERDAPGYNGFDIAMNFEHVISGHRNDHNNFSPRHGRYHLRRIDDRGVKLVREAADSPWKLDSTMTMRLVPPHAIDFEFECVPRDAAVFGEHGYAVLFWANYMNPLSQIPLHFRGVSGPDEAERWIAVEAPATEYLHRHGGVYRSRHAKRLPIDADHQAPWNVASYDYPRFTRPFFFGRGEHDMVLILMFDRMHATDDEIRFALYRFQVKQDSRRPAWDFQYVIHSVKPQKQYGFRGRLVWKKFVSREDCLAEYERWSRQITATGKQPG